MASGYWDSTSDPTWATGANWSGVAKPGTGENATIPGGDNLVSPAGGNEAAVDLALLQLTSESRIGIGSSGTPLIIGFNKLKHLGLGAAYIQNDTDAAINEQVIVNSPNMVDALTLTGTAVSRVLLARGGVSLTPASIGTLNIAKHGRSSRNVICVIGASVVIVQVNMAAGHVEHNGGNITEINQAGGEFIDYSAGGHTLILSGGRFISKTKNSSWTLGSSYILGGECDLRGVEVPVTLNEIWVRDKRMLKYDPAVVTISNLRIINDKFMYGQRP